MASPGPNGPPGPLGFKTFKPNSSKPGANKGNTVRLKAGETLHFKEGFGYYGAKAAPKPSAPYNPVATKPRPPAPRAPVDPFAARTAAQISTQAGTLAQAGLTPQQDEIRRQQALAAAQSVAQQGAITGFSAAAGGILQGIAPQVGEGYQRAAVEQGQLGLGMATGVGDAIRARSAEDQAFLATQGQQGGPGPNADAAQDVLYGLQGQIPASSLAESGAAHQALAAETAALPLAAGRQQLDAAMAKARETNDEYAQQLIQLAAQFPGLKAQAIQQLNAYEVDKANYRLSVTNTKADNRRQDIALKAQLKAAGMSDAYKTEGLKIRWASLEFQSQKAANAAKAAAAKGKTIDVSASKLLGHIVYKDGSEDPSIKVKQTSATNPKQTAAVNRAKATSTARVGAFKYATTLLGKPQPNPKPGLIHGPGKFVARPDVKGTFPAPPGGVRTTNNPALAVREGGAASYSDAQTKVWAQIDGDGLMSRYSYSRQQVMAIVNQALARAGWKK